MKRSNLLGSTSLLILLALIVVIGVSSCKKETVEPETPTVPVVDLTIYNQYQGKYKLIVINWVDVASKYNYLIYEIKDNKFNTWNVSYNPDYMTNSYTMTYSDNKIWITSEIYIYKFELNELTTMNVKTGVWSKYKKL